MDMTVFDEMFGLVGKDEYGNIIELEEYWRDGQKYYYVPNGVRVLFRIKKILVFKKVPKPIKEPGILDNILNFIWGNDRFHTNEQVIKLVDNNLEDIILNWDDSGSCGQHIPKSVEVEGLFAIKCTESVVDNNIYNINYRYYQRSSFSLSVCLFRISNITNNECSIESKEYNEDNLVFEFREHIMKGEKFYIVEQIGFLKEKRSLLDYQSFNNHWLYSNFSDIIKECLNSIVYNCRAKISHIEFKTIDCNPPSPDYGDSSDGPTYRQRMQAKAIVDEMESRK